MEIMELRFNSVLASYEGLKKTGIPLVAYDGYKYNIPGISDDQGIYYFIPQVAHNFSIPIDKAIAIFYLSWNLSALAIGLISFLLLFKSWPEKIISIIALILLALRINSFGYVYAFQASAIVATIPLFLYLSKIKKSTSYLVFFCLLGGIFLGISNHIRAHAGVGAFIFISIMLLFYYRDSGTNKIAIILALIIGFFIPTYYTNLLFNKRNIFLTSQKNTTINIVYRPAWHSIYIGFGFIKNDLGIRYSDFSAIEKVRQVSPSSKYLSKEYIDVLKKEVFKLVFEHPYFVMKNIGAKLGVILFLFIIYSNFGLWLAFKYSKDPGINLAFIICLIFQSSFGILVMPHSWYLLGFITFSTLFGVMSINAAFQQGFLKDIINMLIKRRINT
jgi:hypothetical protein